MERRSRSHTRCPAFFSAIPRGPRGESCVSPGQCRSVSRLYRARRVLLFAFIGVH